MKCEVCGINLDKGGFCLKCKHRYIMISENLNIPKSYRIGKVDKSLYHSEKT